MYDGYTLEKLQEYRQSEWERLERRGLYVQPDPLEKHMQAGKRSLLHNLFGFFRQR
ncbi:MULTISPECIES: hypothetical protein [Paenibacillus]|uniref:Uncharacterized protein n=2 Tax=Paenibacillus lactis TaxID=228574 RepID=G4HAE2_9BACL|nr:hypothetical protein [Paenibacillus lactis]EHB66901.1 hypothetical protein PaelaDRAFT_1125 [Paenibacillus lactis 154]